MYPATPEDIKPWIMSTQTLLEPTRQHPSPTWYNRITFPCFLLPSTHHLSTISEDHQSVASVLQDKFKDTDWSMFASQATCGSHTNIDSHTYSVPEYIINTTINSGTTEK